MCCSTFINCCFLLELISHKEVVAQLAADTLLSEAHVGVGGRCFLPGSYPQLATLCLKVWSDILQQYCNCSKTGWDHVTVAFEVSIGLKQKSLMPL